MNLEKAIEDLQSRIAFQEDTISALSDIVANQDKQLRDVQKKLSLTINKVSDLNTGSNQEVDNMPPPHY